MTTELGTAQAAGEDGESTAVQAVNEAVAEIERDEVDFCQVFCSTKYEYEKVLSGIRSVIGPEAELLGCSSSGEFTEDGVQAGSIVVSVISSDILSFFTSMETGLTEDVQRCIFDAVDGLPQGSDPELDGYPYQAAINLHDGLAGIGNKVTTLTEQYLDDTVKLAGGSAGDDLQLEATHIFQNGRVETDAVGLALIASEKPIPMTVNHGHEPISEPMTVTKAEGSTVDELDNRPAFEVWQDAVREDAMETYDIDVEELEDESDDLSMMLTRYEFGIESKPNNSEGLLERIQTILKRKLVPNRGYTIRWPGLTTETDGPLEFAVEIPEGTKLRIMHSGEEDQIESVRTAARNAVDKTNGTDIAGGFVYDCVCRGTILEDEFDDALEAISDEVEAPFAGFETYGEVCTVDKDYSGYHNTTSVVMLLPE